MGQHPRRKPARLAEKLTRIRTELELSQNGMIRKLGFIGELRQSHISGFELGDREPSLIVLLHYARAAGVPMEVLVDDELDLPKHLPPHSPVRKPLRSDKSR
jgi:transcriptional regulator with XRE-family HTH domain